MPSIVRKPCRSRTHGAFGTLGAYGTSRTYGTPGTLGTSDFLSIEIEVKFLKFLFSLLHYSLTLPPLSSLSDQERYYY